MKRPKELLALVFLLLLGLLPRLAFVARYPTIPVSDFASLVAFGLNLRDHGLLVPGWFWEFFNPGLPLVLSVLFRIFPADPATAARFATALACGLLPLLPFLIWRGVLPLWVRFFAGACLAIWPGQIVFTGVVAQDNWVLLPSVALAALAVRSFITKRASPIAAGLLYTAGVATRPEMLLVLFPLFLAAALTFRPEKKLLVAAVLAAALPLIALAAYRRANTGQFSLSTAHAGISILGSYIPGSTVNAWTDPYPFIASVRPDLLTNRPALLTESTHLAVQEALRRPGFQAARILSMVVNFSITGEPGSEYWSVGDPEVLPSTLRERGDALYTLSQRPLRYEMAAIQGLFLAACLIAIRRRNWPILLLALVVLLKYALHAAIVAQARYFYPATAWELLAIALAAYEIQTTLPASKTLALSVLTIGVIFSLALLLARPRMIAYVSHHDIDQQRTYRFPLEVADHSAQFTCVVSQGVLVSLDLARESTQTAAIRTFDGDPAPGESASAACDLTGAGNPRPLLLDVLDPYAPGGFPDRMLQRVEVDGTEVYSHDFAKDPGSGWAKIPLGDVGAGTKRKVVIEVKALHPDPGPGWGNAAITTFQLSRQ